MRHRYIVKKKQESVMDLIKGAHDAWSGWVCVLLVGLTSGVMAGVIDIGATWLTDLKFGICPSAFYLNMEQCCWSSNETVRDIPGLGQYDDFHTIDWQRDIARDRMRHRYIVKKKQESVMDLIKGAHDAWSGWVCVLLVGLTSG